MIQAYAQEINDGIENLVKTANAISLVAPVIIPKDKVITASIEFMMESVIGLSKDDFDLYPLHSILTSIGWNQNTDIFVKEDTWEARHSPVNKPFNIGHEPRKIIGHITGSYAIAEDGEIIPDETVVANLPNKFHILTSSVIYRHIKSRDDKLEQETAELIEEIQQGKWFVSMEALFANFDYGIIDANGVQQVVARREDTAFLTKHLRAYGGSGEYNGCKLGRVLRGITFSGKGLVKNPANPQSITITDIDSFNGVNASLDEVHFIGELVMAENNKVQELETELEQTKTALAEANKKIAEFDSQTAQAALVQKDEEITKLNETLAAKTSEAEKAAADLADAIKAKDEAVATVAALTEEKTKMVAEIAAIKAKEIATARTSLLVGKGMDATEAEKVVAEFADLDDAKFAKIVELVPAKKMADEEDEEEDKKGECAAEAGEKALEEATPPADPALAAASESVSEQHQQVLASLSAFIAQHVSKTN